MSPSFERLKQNEISQTSLGAKIFKVSELCDVTHMQLIPYFQVRCYYI